MQKDWTGNKNSIYKTLGASNHTEKQRETNDYYATEPKATELLCELETFSNLIWEPACGEGHISKVLINRGYTVISSDLINRGYIGTVELDFLKCNEKFNGDIITNPPYKYAKQFVERALDVVTDDHKVAMFLKLQFLEGKSRKELFENHPPEKIYVSSGRLLCAKNGDFQLMRKSGGSAVAYAWFIWRKGYKGETTIKWFN